MLRFVLACILAALSFAACAVNPWKFDFQYSPTHGDFTVRYNYCVGWQCPAPETFGVRPKIGQGWAEVLVVHAAAGMEYYQNGVPISQEEAQANPFYSAALIMGWGFVSKHRDQTVNGFQLVSMNLHGGYLEDVRIEPGIHRQP